MEFTFMKHVRSSLLLQDSPVLFNPLDPNATSDVRYSESLCLLILTERARPYLLQREGLMNDRRGVNLHRSLLCNVTWCGEKQQVMRVREEERARG